jgi:hypothetical protein
MPGKAGAGRDPHAAPILLAVLLKLVRRAHRDASRTADRDHRHRRPLFRQRGSAAARALNSLELRAHPSAPYASAHEGAARAGRGPAGGRGLHRHCRTRLADLAGSDATRRRLAGLSDDALAKDPEPARLNGKLARVEKGGRRPRQPPEAAHRLERWQRDRAGAGSRHRGPDAKRPPAGGRGPRARAERIGALPVDRGQAPAAARYCRHRAAHCRLHPASARGSARPVDQAIRILRSAARHVYPHRRGHEAQPLFPEPGDDQLGLWHARCLGALAYRHAEPHRLGPSRHADALRALCRGGHRSGATLVRRGGRRSGLDNVPPSACRLRRWRDDHGAGGGAAGVRARHRRISARRDRLHRILDLAVGSSV